MIIENMTKEEMINFIRAYCVRVIKDIPNTNFKAGQNYRFFQDEHGFTLISDDKNNYFLLDYNNANEYLEVK